MGATGTYRKPGLSNREFFTDEFSTLRNGEWEVLADATVGTSGEWRSVWYAAIKDNRPGFDGEVWALVVLMHGSGNTFVYKDMSEQMGPAEDACPAKVLDQLSPTTHEYATAWRQKCRDRITAEKARPTVKAGDTIRLSRPVRFGGDIGEEDVFTYVGGQNGLPRDRFITPGNRMVRMGARWRKELSYTILVPAPAAQVSA